MSRFTLTFLRTGLATTLQDLGRFGYQHLGVPSGGPLDRQSASLANKIVGNDKRTPVIEVTLIGPEIKFDAEGIIAITGGNLSPTLSGKQCKMYRPIVVSAGDILSFGKALTGCRSYIAIAGEWQVKKWLGSASTTTHDPETFTPDSILKTNRTMEIVTSERNIKPLNTSVNPRFSDCVNIGVLPGPEFELFSASEIDQFLKGQHELSTDCNRMAYRLKSKLKGFSPNIELISSGVVPGTIQITNEGQPIILLADAQTTGGYLRIANIMDSDLDILGQLKPGDKVSFSLMK